jgi:hypothetical protein
MTTIYNPIFIKNYNIYDIFYNDRGNIIIIKPGHCKINNIRIYKKCMSNNIRRVYRRQDFKILISISLFTLIKLFKVWNQMLIKRKMFRKFY